MAVAASYKWLPCTVGTISLLKWFMKALRYRESDLQLAITSVNSAAHHDCISEINWFLSRNISLLHTHDILLIARFPFKTWISINREIQACGNNNGERLRC